MPELEALTSRAAELASKTDFWNSTVLWALFVTAMAAGAIVFSQRLAFVRAKQLADVQEQIANIKETDAKNRADDLDRSDIKLRTDLQTEVAKVIGLQKDAINAKAAQQKVEIELTKQQERTARAEKDLLELRTKMKWRHLESDQEKRLIDALKASPVKGPVNIMCILGDAESFAFATQIDEILKAADWTTNGVSQGIFRPNNPTGIELQVHSAQATPPYAAVLQQIFTVVGIKVGASEYPSIQAGNVILVIGLRPPVN
jgi:hypothetical protein